MLASGPIPVVAVCISVTCSSVSGVRLCMNVNSLLDTDVRTDLKTRATLRSLDLNTLTCVFINKPESSQVSTHSLCINLILTAVL